MARPERPSRFCCLYVALSVVAGAFARRYYPMRYETGRLVRVVAAGVLAVGAGLALPNMAPIPGIVARGILTTAVFGGLLWVGGFLRPTERALLRQLVNGGWSRRTTLRPEPPSRNTLQ